MIRHHGLANYLAWAGKAYRATEGAGSIVHSSLGFDLTVTDEIRKIRRDGRSIQDMVKDTAFIDYATYAKYRGKIAMKEAAA